MPSHPKDHAMTDDGWKVVGYPDRGRLWIPEELWDPADGPDPNEPNDSDEWGEAEWLEWYEDRPKLKPIEPKFRRRITDVPPNPYF
jgi:hypothetical protein